MIIGYQTRRREQARCTVAKMLTLQVPIVLVIDVP